MGQHHTDIRQFRVFALILGKEVFVGKTTSPRISAVYSRHRCGNVAATRGILDQEEPPALHILETLNCTGSEAYRHILAWIHLLESAGYSSINHMATAQSSELLYPPTKTILKDLRLEPVDQILKRTHILKPSDGNIKPSRKLLLPPKPEKHVQMNLRMTAKDKKTFDRFCKKHQLKAREALGLLLDQITGEEEHLLSHLHEQKALRQENEKLKEQVAVLQGEGTSHRDRKIAVYLQFLKKGLAEYTEQLCPSREKAQLPAFPYKQFRTQSDIRYEYPEAEGFFLLTAEAVLWGRHRSRFIVGRGQDGEYLKVRYYPDPLYAGALIWDYPAGTWWLVGCRRSADGAMEAVASFLLPSLRESTEEVPQHREFRHKASLDDQIRNASTK